MYKSELINIINSQGSSDILTLSDFTKIFDQAFVMFHSTQPEMEKIKAVVQNYFNAPADYVTNKSRQEKYIKPRYWFIYFARKSYSHGQIGKFASKDRITIYHAEKRVGELISTYSSERNVYKDLQRLLSVDNYS